MPLPTVTLLQTGQAGFGSQEEWENIVNTGNPEGIYLVLLGVLDNNSTDQLIDRVKVGSGTGDIWPNLVNNGNDAAYRAHAAIAWKEYTGSGPGDPFQLHWRADKDSLYAGTGEYAVFHITDWDPAAANGIIEAFALSNSPGAGPVTQVLPNLPTADDIAVGLTYCDSNNKPGATGRVDTTEIHDFTGELNNFGGGNVIQRDASVDPIFGWTEVNDSGDNFSSAQAIALIRGVPTPGGGQVYDGSYLRVGGTKFRVRDHLGQMVTLRDHLARRWEIMIGGTSDELPLSTDFTGIADSSPWPAPWEKEEFETNADADVTSEVGVIYGTSAAYSGGALKAINSLDDFEAFWLMDPNSALEQYPRLWFRSNSGANRFGEPVADGYMLHVNYAFDPVLLSLYRFNGGTSTELTGTIQADARGSGGRYVRIRVEGDRFRMKSWDDGVSEPVAWALDHTDVSPILTAGQLGLGYITGNSTAFRQMTFDNIYITPLWSYEDDFEALSVGTDLVNSADWDVNVRSGGVMRADNHGDHSDGSRVIDFSTTADNEAVYQTELPYDHMTVEMDAFIDTLASSGNIMAVTGRLQSADPANISGYGVGWCQDFFGSDENTLAIFRFDNGARTMLVKTADLEATYSNNTMRRLRMDIDGTTIRGYLDGDLLLTTTDTTYQTGKHAGVYGQRATATSISQPFFDNWIAKNISREAA